MRKYTYKIRLAFAGVMLLLSVLAILGIYFLKVFDIQFAALLQRALLTTSVCAIVLLLGIILLTVIFGRLYCSTLCPLGIMQEFAALILRRKKINKPVKNYPIKHFICALSFASLFAGSAVIIRHIEPYSIFGSASSLTLFGLIFLLAVLVLVFFKNRFFCTNICPIGAFLGSCAKSAVKSINIDEEKCISCKMCERNCPAGCIDIDNKKIDNEMCLKCFKCYSICPKEAIYYGHKKISFEPSRRKAIIGTSAAVLLVAGYLAGIKIIKESANKLKNIILPAGAKNSARMFNKCLNCNLCIENCPNKILVKANDEFSAVHIDYKKGEGFCEYNCHKCGDVCPSDAIKRISLAEKQNVRIAMASIKSDTCIKCGRCILDCPKEAISKDDNGIAVLDASKCIGCGKCAKTCPNNSIEIYGIKEQTII